MTSFNYKMKWVFHFCFTWEMLNAIEETVGCCILMYGAQPPEYFQMWLRDTWWAKIVWVKVRGPVSRPCGFSKCQSSHTHFLCSHFLVPSSLLSGFKIIICKCNLSYYNLRFLHGSSSWTFVNYKLLCFAIKWCSLLSRIYRNSRQFHLETVHTNWYISC